MYTDKDTVGTVKVLSRAADDFVVTQASNPRALPASELATTVSRQCKQPVRSTGSVVEALAESQRGAGPDDAICVTGSLSVVGEAMQTLNIEL